MKSTLPVLFAPTPPTFSYQNSPKRQIPFYHLDLGHNTLHFRTKIINPLHKKSLQEDRLPQKMKIGLNFKSRYGTLGSKSLRKGEGDEKQKQQRSFNYGNGWESQKKYGTIDLEGSRGFKSYSSMSQHGESLHRSNISKLQQFDSVKAQLKRVAHQSILLQKSLSQIPQLHELYLMQLNSSSKRLHFDLNNVEQQIKQKISTLSNTLSTLRRETNLQIKSMRRQLQDMVEEVREEKQLIEDLEAQRAEIRRVNF